MMHYRNYLALKAPMLLGWLQKHRVAPNPLTHPRTRRTEENSARPGYSFYKKGDYHLGAPIPPTMVRPSGASGSSYSAMIAGHGSDLPSTRPFGYFDVHDVRYSPNFGVHSSPNGNFIDTYCSDAALGNPKYELARLALPVMPLGGRWPEGILIAPAWYHNFYHWLVDILPRLANVTDSLKAGVPIIVPDRLSRVQLHTLRLALAAAGVPQAEVIALNGGTHHFARAIIPTRLSATLDMSHAQRNFMRAMMPGVDSQPSGRIYVSRRDAAIRRIVNEDEIEALLQRRGFRTVTMSGLPFEEQARLFGGAEAIIGHHGAAFASWAFCRAGTPAIEIFQEGHFAPSFARMAQLGELRYGFCVGKAQDADTWLDPAQLEEVLGLAGL